MSAFKICKSNFVFFRDDDILAEYEIFGKIGEGSQGKVFRAENKHTGLPVAIKQIEKSTINDYQGFMNEIETLKKFDHPNILKLYEVYEDDEYVNLVQELCTGPDLFEKITEKEYLDEEHASKYFLQILRAIAYWHSNNICHRDIKPENFIFKSSSEDSLLKLIDFGISQSLTHEKTNTQSPKLGRMTTWIGTTYYMAPEVLNQSYTMACDMWAAGVMLYSMLSGFPPFIGESIDDILDSIKKCDYDFKDEVWDNVSSNWLNLIQELLVKEDSRLSATQALEHPWMKKHFTVSTFSYLEIEQFKAFLKLNKIKRAALVYIASRTEDQEVKEYTHKFLNNDEDFIGTIKADKLIKWTGRRSMTRIASLSVSDTITYTEFIASQLKQAEIFQNDEIVGELFRIFDYKNRRWVDWKELREILKASEDEMDIEWMQEADQDHRWMIEFSRFKSLITT